MSEPLLVIDRIDKDFGRKRAVKGALHWIRSTWAAHDLESGAQKN